MTSVINVNLPQQSYEIAIASGSLELLGQRMADLKLGKKVLLVSNPTIFKHYGEKSINLWKMLAFKLLAIVSQPENATKLLILFKNSTILP